MKTLHTFNRLTRLGLVTFCALLLTTLFTSCANQPTQAEYERERVWVWEVAAISQQRGEYFVGFGPEIKALYQRGLTPQQAFEELRRKRK